MYSNNIIIAVKLPYSKKVKKAIPNSFEYTMEQKNNINFYLFEDVLWHDGMDPFSEAIIEVLADIPYNDFSFIRIGNDPIDIEIHGNPSALDITTSFEITY